MFLFLDESSQYKKKLIGCLLVPKDLVPNIEKEFVELRIKHKLFGEIKWSQIDKYYKRYIDFLDLFLGNKQITFHSICYRYKKYNAAFSLIRTISWKLQNAGINKSLWILFDNDGRIGKQETEQIKKIAKSDIKFKHSIDFCNQGASQVLGCLQLTDIITGAVCSVANKVSISKEKKAIIEHITEVNSNLPLDFSNIGLPMLQDRKIHYFDPDDKVKAKV